MCPGFIDQHVLRARPGFISALKPDLRLEVEIPAQEFLIARLPSPKALIYLKASLCPLWPHLAICCTWNGFSLIWPNWSCSKPRIGADLHRQPGSSCL